MSKEMRFFVYLLEYYAENKKTTADRILEIWDKYNMLQSQFKCFRCIFVYQK